MSQRVRYQLLGRHIDHVVFPLDDAGQLQINSVLYDFGQLLPVQLMGFGVDQIFQLLSRVLQLGGKQPPWQGRDIVAALRNPVGISDDHLIAVLLPQIGELLQHLVRGLEVDGHILVRIGKALRRLQDMAVDLVLRVEKMHVSRGTAGDVQILCQTQHRAVELPQLLFVSRLALSDEEAVVADGLNLQIVVPACNPLQLLVAFVVYNGTKQLSRLAGRADNQSLPALVDVAFGHNGAALEVLQMGLGDELIQIAQAVLVLCQYNEVVWLLAALAQPAQGLHGGVDLVDSAHAQIPQHLPEGHHHIAHHGSVVAGTVMVELRQVQPVCHNIQLVLAQIGQQVLGENQRINGGVGEIPSHALAAHPEKAHVKVGVVGGKGALTHPVQKGIQRLALAGGVRHHLVGNARQLHHLTGDGLLRLDKGIVPLPDLPVFQHHGTDLRDIVPVAVQSGGLNVEAHDLVVQRGIRLAVNHHPVVHVIDIVRLHAVEDFDFVPGGVPCVWEGLGDAVVGDGNRLVSP